MRACEFLKENYFQNLESDLENFLVGAAAAGAAEIRIDDLVLQLRNEGYDVNKSSILTLLSGNSIVASITPDTVRFKKGKPTKTTKDSAEHVAKMAQKAVDI